MPGGRRLYGGCPFRKGRETGNMAKSETKPAEQDADEEAAADGALGSLPHSLGFTLRRVQLAYKRHFIRLAAGTEFQLNHVGPMALIARNPGIAPSALASALTIDAAQVTGIINQLELRGFGSRRKSPSDSRS